MPSTFQMADNKDASQVLNTTPDQVVINRAPPTGLAPLRHSQLSDSGAESCYEGDEQARLIRSSSSRAHKFIIIPATPGTPPGSGAIAGPLPFRQTSSTTSLAAMAAALHKQSPLRQTSVRTRPSSEVLQPGQVLANQPTAAVSTSTVTFTIDDCNEEGDAIPAAASVPAPVTMPAISPTPATLTCTTTTTMAGDSVAVSPLSMELKSRLGSHHSSMRSVVSGW